MIKTFRDTLAILNRTERRRLYALLALFLVRAPVEVLGIASIMPFLAVAASPGVIETNAYLAYAYDWLGLTSTGQFLHVLGATVFVLIMIRIAVDGLTQYATIRFSAMRSFGLSHRLLGTYLDQPYHWFLNRHSADLGKSILTEVQQVVSGVMLPSLKLLSSALVATFVVGLVVVVDPAVALASATLIGIIYGIIYGGTRRYLLRIGRDRVDANRERYQLAQEAISGIKDVKVLGLEDEYARRFYGPARRFALNQASSSIITAFPGLGLQALVQGGGLILVLWLMAERDGDLSAILPLIGLYAMAGQRLIPVIQAIFQAVATIRFNAPALQTLKADMQLVLEAGDRPPPRSTIAPHALREQLELRDVRFAYPSAESPALDGLSITIPAHTSVGLVGATGAGKTTAVDLILGLLLPQSGELRVDGTPVTGATVRAWQRSIGYVSQHIFLADDTVAANIAFGIPPAEVDMDAVERAARIAELHDFVIQDMPKGYQTMIGERGVRLSGGQRQRIGIARALYYDPDVLVLDEATSALDNLTERAVMDAVRNLGRSKTIIMIAHRLSTVRHCDQIFMLARGRLSGAGTYDELMARDATFRSMATP